MILQPLPTGAANTFIPVIANTLATFVRGAEAQEEKQ